jgi:hypothetical protein
LPPLRCGWVNTYVYLSDRYSHESCFLERIGLGGMANIGTRRRGVRSSMVGWTFIEEAEVLVEVNVAMERNEYYGRGVW